MDFVFFMILFGINGYKHFVPGIIITAIPFFYYMFKRQFSRVQTIALILMVLSAILSAIYAAIWVPTPVYP